MAEEEIVSVKEGKSGFKISFPYDRELVSRINKIEGAKFDPKAEVWEVPKSSKEALDKIIDGLYFEAKAIENDRQEIFGLATETANARGSENGSPGVDAKVSEYHESGNNYSGEIINVNGRFAAQLTGFGRDNGAPFVTVHRLANLTEPVFKGDDVRIKYNTNGIGDVFDRSKVKSQAELLKEFEDNLGKVVSGIHVEKLDDSFLIAFEYNPDIQHRLQRISGVEFDKENSVWKAPLSVSEFVVRAVADMRKEFIADANERDVLSLLAKDKVDGAKVRDAFTKDGIGHYGKVIDVSERYILQHGGQDEFKLHKKSALDKEVSPGQSLKISYEKGRGKVEDRNQSKDKSNSLQR